MAVYVAARDLSGMPVGTHQFIIIAFDNLCPAPLRVGFRNVVPRQLGKETYGFVIGAQNRNKLMVEFFEKGDLTAAMEHFGGVTTAWWKSDYDAEVVRVSFTGSDEASGQQRVLDLVDTYILNQTVSPISYPTAGLGVNSNSWAQSVIAYAGGKTISNMSGFDVSSDKRIPKTYFEPYCPVKPRPRVN